jgi:ribulose-phosphate 3-epimerase
MSVIISPSILGGTFSNMEKIISDLDKSKAEYIHFDVMDGDFVPNLTFGPQFISNLRGFSKKVFDVHLMINRVGKFINDYINTGADLITFHVEIDENINEIIKTIKSANIKCGISLKPNTSWESIKPYLENLDQILVMTVEPGFGGQLFMNDQLEKIKKIREFTNSQNVRIDIQVDGGINYETGKLCTDAGANVLVAGSFLFKQENLTLATNQLCEYFN